MAFVNEKISEEDKMRIEPVLKKIASEANFIYHYSAPQYWTIDRERDLYLVHLTSNAPDWFGDYYVFGIDGQYITFYADPNPSGNPTWSKNYLLICELEMPSNLEEYRTKINQLIIESLKKGAWFNPFSIGSNSNNQNTIHIEFESK
jgi:hypothetical protein